jgi:hypothetical protein
MTGAGGVADGAPPPPRTLPHSTMATQRSISSASSRVSPSWSPTLYSKSDSSAATSYAALVVKNTWVGLKLKLGL